MQLPGKRWSVQDKRGHDIYLTQERWQHIIAANNHPEMADYEDHLKQTVQKGKRRQEPMNPRKYRYTHYFDDLPDDFNNLVVIVLFGFDIDVQGQTIANNFVATAFMKHIRHKR